MVFNKTEKQEKDYLKQITGKIEQVIQAIHTAIAKQEQNLREHKDYIWHSRADLDKQEHRSMRESILNTLAIGESIIAKRQRLTRILDIPYFGRVDFHENKKEAGTLPVYIGIHTFYDQESQTNLIYDWRAPISGMFYDYELGEAGYSVTTERIEGHISLKRQYRIRQGVMEYMIESSVTVHDDVLQKELSQTSDDRMKNIVATIQREQNRIIRNEDAQVLIIQGVAGSGKTSIALHRVAYLLYSHKGTLSSSDILIISPNKVFGNYISNVLPELGEESVPETSMEQLLSGVLEHKYKYQTFFGQVAELLDKPSPGFIGRIRYKSTFEFISRLDRFILHVENTHFRPVDVKVRHITVPPEHLMDEYRRFHRYPVRQRFDVMADFIMETLEMKYLNNVTTAERNAFKKNIRSMFDGQNDLQLYQSFFDWAGAPDMFKLRRNRTLEYADLAPLAYLRIALDGLKNRSQARHLLIDEMQDYSPIQYKVILKLFPCPKTILGDANQSVNPYGSSTAPMIERAMIKGQVMKLCKSYRSTYEITDFAQRIQANEELEAIARHGDKPQIIRFKDSKEEIDGIAAMIKAFRTGPYQSLGIICKDEKQAADYYEKLKGYDKSLLFLSSQSSMFSKGAIITSAHMAKGLEFDTVIIPGANEKNYHTDIDRNMLYVAVTRAMHQLTLTHSHDLTGLVRISSGR